MANKTTFLKLIKPLNQEYQDTWDVPMNDNSDLIDSWASDIDAEVTESRYGKASLKTFLDIGHESDGSNKAVAEVIKSRSSFIYGDEDNGSDFLLNDRLQALDEDLYDGEEGQVDLRTNLSTRTFQPDMVISGTKDSNGYPSWLGFTGSNVKVDGSVDNIWMLIDGFKCRIRNEKLISITGGTGPKYLFANFAKTGEVVIDESATSEGVIGSDGTKLKVFQDATKDFTLENVEPGDIIEILGTHTNTGKFVISEIAPDGENDRLLIRGVFPGTGMASLGYTITDPVGVTLGFEETKAVATSKFHFGESEYDGSSISSVTAIHFKNYFVGEWRAVDLTSDSFFLEEWNHNLMDDALEYFIQVSQGNDGTQSIETLSNSGLTNTLSVNVSSTLALSPLGPSDSGTGDQDLTGSAGGTLDGLLYLNRSARIQFDQSKISVKNNRSDLFYVGFDDTEYQTGYIRVIVKKIRN